MSAVLRCVFYDPDAVDAGSRLSERAFEACARADVEVFALAGDEDAVEVDGERHDVAGEDGAIAFVMRALGLTPRAVHRRRRARSPARRVGAVWVSPLDLEVRGPHVRVAEEGDELLYEAVISELAARRRALSANRLVRVGQELVQPQAGGARGRPRAARA